MLCDISWDDANFVGLKQSRVGIPYMDQIAHVRSWNLPLHYKLLQHLPVQKQRLPIRMRLVVCAKTVEHIVLH